MDKKYAIDLLGGTPTKAAKVIGCTPQAVSQWADPIPERVEAVVMFHYQKLTPVQRRAGRELAAANQAILKAAGIAA